MLRQASSRNQRTKGFRVKHALQIFLLVAVCVWLLYQVKHSHDKKRAYEEKNSKILNKVVETEPDIFKFGRKDLPRSEETGSVNETHNKEEESEEAQEEEEEEQEVKQEETEDEEGRGAGDDEIDEQDQVKADEEDEHGEELTEEEDKADQFDDTDLFDNQDNDGGSQEAREENYKRDDASSAVVHDTHETESETGNGDARNSNEGQMDTMEEKDIEAENVANETVDGSNVYSDPSVGTVNSHLGNASDVVRENVTMPKDNFSMNSTGETREIEAESSKLNNESISNSTPVEYNNQGEENSNSMTAARSNDQLELLPNNIEENSTAATRSNDKLQLPTNSTAVVSNDQKDAENNSTVVVPGTNGAQLQNDTVSMDSAQDQNATVDKGTPKEDMPNLGNVAVDLAEKSNTTVGLELEKQSTTSSVMNDTGDVAQGESDGSLHGIITEEERDIRTDLSTLPDIQNEVAKSVEDEATE